MSGRRDMTVDGLKKLPELRIRFAPHFAVKRLSSSTIITYKGDILVRVRSARGNPGSIGELPTGFHARLIQHIANLLTGRFTQLWDEQAIWGATPVDSQKLYTLAMEEADRLTMLREQPSTREKVEAAASTIAARMTKLGEGERASLRAMIVRTMMEALA
jgi:hypothetical protein